jgi:UDP-2-acetamido-2-deoxy-ribo-hexuluronate aminotransferase
MDIKMVDLVKQYQAISTEIDNAILSTVKSAEFINGSEVKKFSNSLAEYNHVKHVIPCANGTDALQLALMALGLNYGDEVIVPAFTYVATAEVTALLGLVPVMVDVDPYSFNLTADLIKKAITNKTKAIVPVHLFGQCADMESILKVARDNHLFVIEDAAQAIGSEYTFIDGTVKMAGTMGNIGCTSFFPSKNLGCYGDGGAVFTNDDGLAETLRMIANHGQREKYYHSVIGINSRLDTIQAAILNIKLKYLDSYSETRRKAAYLYDKLLKEVSGIITPVRSPFSTHVFHQYTLQIKDGKRDALKKYLESKGIPSMIYYPLPLSKQDAFKSIGIESGQLEITETLCNSVLSLPMHTELDEGTQIFIADHIKSFFN